MPKDIHILLVGFSGFGNEAHVAELIEKLRLQCAKKTDWLLKVETTPGFVKAVSMVAELDSIEAISFVYDPMLMRYDEFIQGCIDVGKALGKQGKTPMAHFEDPNTILLGFFRAHGMQATSGDFAEACGKRWNARPALLAIN